MSIAILSAVLLVAWLAATGLALRFGLGGPDLRRFDRPRLPSIGGRREASVEHGEAVKRFRAGAGALAGLSRSDRLSMMRRLMDAGLGASLVPAQIEPVDAGGVPAEWVIADGAFADRRFLYLHGGAFTMGSPRSHRMITTRLSALTNAAVLSVDYRLMPEHPRRAGIEDCRAAYRFALANGPEGAGAPSALFAGGDSAGGNLVLMLIAWARDAGLRPVGGALPLSPATDMTLTSPSFAANIATDPMLGAAFGWIAKVPGPLRLLGSWLQSRIRPSDPSVSPVFGDLAGLPPVLVQASEHEMLVDDARRWVNKARIAGSPAELQIWPHMIHVWHAFPELPEAREAYEQIGLFFERCAPARRQRALAG